MFSEQDLRELFENLPPQKPPTSAKLSILPPLVLSSRGEGFVTEKSVSRKFQTLVKDEQKRLPLTVVSNKLNVDNDTTLILLRANPLLALLSKDENSVITTTERNSIVAQLRESLESHVVSKDSFSNQADVSPAGINALVHSLVHSDEVNTDFGEGIRELDGHLFSARYEQAMSRILKEKLDRSLEEAEPLEITTSSFEETAPLWFLHRVTNSLINEHDLSEQFHINEDAGSTRYVPRESIIRRRDAILAQMESGELTHIDIRTFTEHFKDIFPSFSDTNEYLADLDSIFHLTPFAISRSWIASLANKYIEILDDKDYVDCAADLPSDLPRAIYDSVLGLVVHRVISWDSSLAEEDFCQIGSFVLTKPHYDRERAILFDLAKAQANTQWQAYKGKPEKDLKFQAADIHAAIAPDRPVLRSVAKEEGVESAIAEHFWRAVSDLESRNEAEFAAFWTKRVLSRQHSYCEALKAIEDTKLYDQLVELLANYLQKELVPDTMTRAQSQGLISSRKTKRNVQKLETALNGGKKDLSGVLSFVDKFGKKQDIPTIDTASLEEAKKVMVSDMVRRMQKSKIDGPLLFLTLIVVLFAKHHTGVVYATGKFAPKLLKLLKSKMSAEDYAKLETWKDSAKLSTLGADDQKAMNEMVSQAS